MRRSLSLLLIAYIASFIGACSTFEEEKVDVPIQEGFNLPEQIYANIEEEHTRVYVEEGMSLSWNKGDELSFFTSGVQNVRYCFNGETGDKGGSFTADMTSGSSGSQLSANYALYPYATDNKIVSGGVITTSLFW